MQRRRAFLGTLLAGSAGLLALAGDEIRTRPPSDRLIERFDTLLQSELDEFGEVVSLSGDGSTVQVGKTGGDAGAVHTYTQSQALWTRSDTVRSGDSGGPGSSLFGEDLDQSRDGSVAIVGEQMDSRYDTEHVGRATVYTQSGRGMRSQTVLGPDGDDFDEDFGEAVALSADGQYALVSATYDELPDGSPEGTVYVFHRSGGEWNQQAKLGPASVAEDDRFGNAVALDADGSTALVGANYTDYDGPEYDDTPESETIPVAGAAYLFSRDGSTWSLQRRLTPEDPWYLFGHSVALSADGSTALVGARRPDGGPWGSGAAYIYRQDSEDWEQETRLAFDGNDERARFGVDVALDADGTTALVGDNFHHTEREQYTGSALVFRHDGSSWRQSLELGGRRVYADNFGYAVSLDAWGELALIGNPTWMPEEDADFRPGAAYLFDITPD